MLTLPRMSKQVQDHPEDSFEAAFSVGTYHAVPGCAQKYNSSDRYSVIRLRLIPTPTLSSDWMSPYLVSRERDPMDGVSAHLLAYGAQK